MTRRDFLASGGAACVLGVAGCALPWPAERRTVRFGVVADAHYSTRKRWRDRHYADSLAKMRQAVDAFNTCGLDFAIELGDLKDMGLTLASTRIGRLIAVATSSGRGRLSPMKNLRGLMKN